MLIELDKISKEKFNTTQCIIWYILQNMQFTKPSTIYLEDLIWMVSKLNTKLFNKYLIEAINIEVFNLLIDFDNDDILDAENYRPKYFSNYKCLSYISQAVQDEVEHLTKCLKIYGKYYIRLKKLFKL